MMCVNVVLLRLGGLNSSVWLSVLWCLWVVCRYMFSLFLSFFCLMYLVRVLGCRVVFRFLGVVMDVYYVICEIKEIVWVVFCF